MKKTKLFTSFVLASISLGIVACTSKEKAIDYSTWTYSQFAEAEKTTENYWNNKEIVYQFAEQEDNNISVYKGVYWGMANLYKDGSVALWEPSGLVTIDYFDGVEGYDKKYALLELFYGFWTEIDGEITVNLRLERLEEPLTYKTKDPSKIQMELYYSGGTCGLFDFINTNAQYSTWESYCETHNTIVTDLEG